MHHPYITKQRGFTLIEFMITLLIFTMVGLVIFAFQRNVLQTSSWFVGNLQSQLQIQRLFKEFEREVRTMAPSQAGAYPIAEASSTEFIFFSDYDRDGYKERIRYFYSTTSKSIKKGVVEPSGVGTTTYNTANEIITDRVQNITIGATTTTLFNYYDANYDGVGTNTPMTSPVNIPSVRLIKLLIAVTPKGQRTAATSSIYFQTQVTARNLKDNL
jgi:prepilin-type N-terminal cleavage/methylation domain-containing protein